MRYIYTNCTPTDAGGGKIKVTEFSMSSSHLQTPSCSVGNKRHSLCWLPCVWQRECVPLCQCWACIKNRWAPVNADNLSLSLNCSTYGNRHNYHTWFVQGRRIMTQKYVQEFMKAVKGNSCRHCSTCSNCYYKQGHRLTFNSSLRLQVILQTDNLSYPLLNSLDLSPNVFQEKKLCFSHSGLLMWNTQFLFCLLGAKPI